MDSIQDLLNIKADNIDTTHNDELTLLQAKLDKLYKAKVKIQSLNERNVLHLSVGEGALASELRMDQVKIRNICESVLGRELRSVRISVR